MAQRIPARLSAAAGRKFGLTVGIAFLVFAAALWWRAGRGLPSSSVLIWNWRRLLSASFATVGVVLTLAGLVIPTRLGPAERAWMGLAHAISKVTTPVFMAVVYFLVLLPIGLIMRMLGRNPLKHGTGGSAWIVRDVRRGDLRRQF